ncbi:MAG: glycosyltransferase family 39 protein [Magnetococcales bacterium]|nr:glycosyltransferase family 39 protein [Magnetococcales bacterium]
MSWDEYVQIRYGEHILNFYASNYSDLSALVYKNLYLYGGLFDTVVQGMVRLFPNQDPLLIRRLLSGLVGWLGMVGVWRLGHLVGGARTGFLSLLLIATTPSYFGHMFINPKDFPFAVGYIWTLLMLVRIGRTYPDVPWKEWMGFGIVLGMTLAVRIGGVLLLAYALTGLIVATLLSTQCRKRESLLRNGAFLTLALLFTFIIMVIPWPSALVDPVTTIQKAFSATTHFPYQSWPNLFQGTYHLSHALPWTYYPVYFGVKIPELFLLSTVLAIPFGLVSLIRSGFRQDTLALSGWFFLGIALVVPLLYPILFNSIHYDAIRHFLFILPPMAVLAGWTLHSLLNTVQNVSRGAAVVVLTICVITPLSVIADMVRIHPYQYAYYNHLTGGISGAENRFELDYWGTSFKEAASIIRTHSKQLAHSEKPQRYTVYSCGPISTLMPFLGTDYQRTRDRQNADYIVLLNRSSCHRLKQGKPIGPVEREGVPMAWVFYQDPADRQETVQ